MEAAGGVAMPPVVRCVTSASPVQGLKQMSSEGVASIVTAGSEGTVPRR